MSTTCYELSQHQHEASKLVPLTSSFKCCPLLQNCLHRHSVAFRPQISLFASLLKFLLLLLPSTGSALSSMWRSRHQLSLTLNETMNLLRHSQRLILRSSLRDSHSSNSISCCRSLARRQKTSVDSSNNLCRTLQSINEILTGMKVGSNAPEIYSASSLDESLVMILRTFAISC